MGLGWVAKVARALNVVLGRLLGRTFKLIVKCALQSASPCWSLLDLLSLCSDALSCDCGRKRQLLRSGCLCGFVRDADGSVARW